MQIEQSAQRRAFAFWLRTGRRLVTAPPDGVERKFNPYHDPRNGRFTFAPGGSGTRIEGGSGPRARPSAIDRVVFPRPSGSSSASIETAPQGGSLNDGVYRPDGTTLLHRVQRGPLPPRIGSNSGAFQDPMILEQAFPGLTGSPGGAIVAMADGFLDILGPAQNLTATMSAQYTKVLIEQIQAIDPDYRLQSLGTPVTFEGQMNQIKDLRFDHAAALYRARAESRSLQLETLRFLQEQTDMAYAEGLRRLKAGRLRINLSPEEALGNFVDRAVREDMRHAYSSRGIPTTQGNEVRINSREYDSSGTDRTYRRPDVRVGDVAFDVTLTRKTVATPQVRGFFSSDFRPHTVVIIRPTQLGRDGTYAITQPRR